MWYLVGAIVGLILPVFGWLLWDFFTVACPHCSKRLLCKVIDVSPSGENSLHIKMIMRRWNCAKCKMSGKDYPGLNGAA